MKALQLIFFHSALTPTPPFSSLARIRVAAVMGPFFLVSFFLNEKLVYKSVMLAIGFGMFGQPIIDRIDTVRLRAWLDKNLFVDSHSLRGLMLIQSSSAPTGKTLSNSESKLH